VSFPNLARTLFAQEICVAEQIARTCDPEQNAAPVLCRRVEGDQSSTDAIDHVPGCARKKMIFPSEYVKFVVRPTSCSAISSARLKSMRRFSNILTPSKIGANRSRLPATPNTTRRSPCTSTAPPPRRFGMRVVEATARPSLTADPREPPKWKGRCRPWPRADAVASASHRITARMPKTTAGSNLP
jgi:hypothetical protein